MRYRFRLSTTIISAFVLVFGAAIPAGADPHNEGPQGYMEIPFGVGYFYGTFGEDPDIILTVGGTAEEFCAIAAAEDIDPFNAEPGETTARMFVDDDGSIDFKVNDKGQPFHLYHSEVGDAPVWINAVCDGEVEPDLFASGTADLKVRLGIDGDVIDVFNSVNGKATGIDGTEYKVRAWADLIVIDDEPQGDPADFVGFELREIKRR